MQPCPKYAVVVGVDSCDIAQLQWMLKSCCLLVLWKDGRAEPQTGTDCAPVGLAAAAGVEGAAEAALRAVWQGSSTLNWLKPHFVLLGCV